MAPRRALLAAAARCYAMAARAPTWDAAQGVWLGDRAVSTVEAPSPLWIFGYGSLCWKPEFPHDETLVGRN